MKAARVAREGPTGGNGTRPPTEVGGRAEPGTPVPLGRSAHRSPPTGIELRRAYHWAGPKCSPENCPGVDECCYAEDDGTGPDNEARWQAFAGYCSGEATRGVTP